MRLDKSGKYNAAVQVNPAYPPARHREYVIATANGKHLVARDRECIVLGKCGIDRQYRAILKHRDSGCGGLLLPPTATNQYRAGHNAGTVNELPSIDAIHMVFQLPQ
jgi:NAD-dependent dihydropyrimidine dehydrogenase PreA subunit